MSPPVCKTDLCVLLDKTASFLAVFVFQWGEFVQKCLFPILVLCLWQTNHPEMIRVFLLFQTTPFILSFVVRFTRCPVVPWHFTVFHTNWLDLRYSVKSDLYDISCVMSQDRHVISMWGSLVHQVYSVMIQKSFHTRVRSCMLMSERGGGGGCCSTDGYIWY